MDTSVLVPVFYGDHERHLPSVTLFKHASPALAACGAHTLAEVYSTLTRMPGRHRISSDQAMLFLSQLREKLNVVALTSDDYFACLDSNSGKNIVGGTIYDALLAHCALKVDAEQIYFWNTRHYQLLGANVASRLRTPAQFNPISSSYSLLYSEVGQVLLLRSPKPAPAGCKKS